MVWLRSTLRARAETSYAAGLFIFMKKSPLSKSRKDISYKTIPQEVAKQTARILDEGCGIRSVTQMNGKYRRYQFAIQIFREDPKDIYYLYQFYGGDKMNITKLDGIERYWYNSHGYTTIEMLRVAYVHFKKEKELVRMILQFSDRISEGSGLRLSQEEKDERFAMYQAIKAEHKRNKPKKVRNPEHTFKKDFIGMVLTDEVLARAAAIVDYESFPSITYQRDKYGDIQMYKFFMKIRREIQEDLDFLSEYFGFSYNYHEKTNSYWMTLREKDLDFLEKIYPWIKVKKEVVDAIFSFFKLVGNSYKKSVYKKEIDTAFESFRYTYSYERQKAFHSGNATLADRLGLGDGNDQ